MVFIDGGFCAIIQKNHLEMRHYHYAASIFAHCPGFSRLTERVGLSQRQELATESLTKTDQNVRIPTQFNHFLIYYLHRFQVNVYMMYNLIWGDLGRLKTKLTYF